jgi:hypothetical protein
VKAFGSWCEAALNFRALGQLSMLHEELIVLATLLADPEINAEPLPELPKKIVGF